LIGRSGATVKSMRESSGCHISIASDLIPGTGDKSVVLQGTVAQVSAALALVTPKLAENPVRTATTVPHGGVGLPGAGGPMALAYGGLHAGALPHHPGLTHAHAHPHAHPHAHAHAHAHPHAHPHTLLPHTLPHAHHPLAMMSTVHHQGLSMVPGIGLGGRGGRGAPVADRGSAATGAGGADRGVGKGGVVNLVATTGGAAQPYGQAHHAHQGGAGAGGVAQLPGMAVPQELPVQNELAGSIIGRGGVIINEIRQMSGAQIKITESRPGVSERIVTISGTPEAQHVAYLMLSSRIQAELNRIMQNPGM
jgi:heterogeneous nuclear rnp K-like protein 2